MMIGMEYLVDMRKFEITGGLPCSVTKSEGGQGHSIKITQHSGMDDWGICQMDEQFKRSYRCALDGCGSRYHLTHLSVSCGYELNLVFERNSDSGSGKPDSEFHVYIPMHRELSLKLEVWRDEWEVAERYWISPSEDDEEDSDEDYDADRVYPSIKCIRRDSDIEREISFVGVGKAIIRKNTL